MRGNRVDLKNVPLGAWVFASITVLGMLGALVTLSVSGADTTQFWRLLNVAGNLAGILAGTGSVVYAGAAARNSQAAVQQTNGNLDARIQKAIGQALVHHDNETTP